MMEHSRGFRGIGMGLIRNCNTAAIAVAVAISFAGCASMGPTGATRADTAKALGLAPSDVFILSRDYEETGPGPADIALANYTIQTSAGYTYICDLESRPGARGTATQQPVCKRKP